MARAAYALLLTLGMGAAAGLVNGVVIAFLGVPAVVMTLAMNGIMEGLTLGLSGGMTCGSCASYAPPIVQAAVHGSVFGIPAAAHPVGRRHRRGVVAAELHDLRPQDLRDRQQRARRAILAGINVRLITVLLYVLSGLFAALAGILLVGFGGQASLGMGDPYLFQSIAAVVIGGVYMLGGRGHYLGTAAGAVTLVALVSVLLAMNMPDYGRNIIYGIVILVLLLLYGREEKEE